MVPTSVVRRTVSAAALIVGVWALLAGLFAMHALPMQQPQAMASAMVMSAAADASAELAMHHQSAGTTHDVQPAGGVQAANGDAVLTNKPGRQVSSVPAAGCEGADHCTATLRTPDMTAPPAVVSVAGPVAPVLQRSALPAPSAPQPRPPDLDTLQISRT